MKRAVIGGGSWGTALATVLAQHGDVTLWARDAQIVRSINEDHRNYKYQSDIALPPQLRATDDLDEAIVNADLIVFVVPSHAMRTLAQRCASSLKSGALIVSASKGIENESLMTMEEVLSASLPRKFRSDLAFLSGPSFARETMEHQATAVTVAARFLDVAEEVQQHFTTSYFRVYTTEDVTGVELGGALKNVIAIAAGVADGLGLGHNSRAALITRGIAEITRLAVKMGANPLTLSGLSGMGDLILTCTGGLSRNRRVGFELGQGRSLQEIITAMNEVAEGVKTSKSAYNLARREGVDMPITREVYAMLYEGKSPQNTLRDLMRRNLKGERDV
jgi:glycerol-3-phosphate dehydrogenase (NAD(P)+)